MKIRSLQKQSTERLLPGTWIRPQFDFAFPRHLLHAQEQATRLASRYFVLCTSREGGVSEGKFASMNLGRAQGDDQLAVSENRRRLDSYLPWPSQYMRLCHGHHCIRIDPQALDQSLPEADAVLLCDRGVAVVMLTGDCLPIVLADAQGNALALVHAGWRGLAAGVIEAAVLAMRQHISHQARMLAWIGPSIGASAFEVGEDVLLAFSPPERCHLYFRKRGLRQTGRVSRLDPVSSQGLAPGQHEGERWMADLLALARRRLRLAGVDAMGGGLWCTWHDSDRFFSHRRQSGGGRFATAIARL